MGQFSAVIFSTLPMFCLSLILFFRRPLHATMYFLVFRSIFSVAAYLHIGGIGNLPFFVPAFVMLWLVFGLYFAFISVNLGPLALNASLIVLCVAMVVSSTLFAVISPDNTGEFGTTTLKFILPVGVYLGAYAGLRTNDDFRKLPGLLAGFLIVPVSVGILQSLAGVSYDYAQDAFVHGTRPVGTIIDPNAYGIFLCMGAFLVAPFALRKGARGMKALLVAIVLAILLAKNRGSWICAAAATTIGIAVFYRYFNMAKVLGLAAVVTLVAAPVVLARFGDLGGLDQFGQSQDTFSQRLEQSQHLLGVAALAPITGYGAGSAEQPWGSSTISRPPHNDYVRMVYEYGIPIALMYGIFLFHRTHPIAGARLSRMPAVQAASSSAACC